MSNKRKLSIDFSNLLDTIYDKIDSNQLQEYLEEMLDEINNADNTNNTDNLGDLDDFTQAEYIMSTLSMIPGIGPSHEDVEDNIRNGNVVELVELVTNIFRKTLTSGQFEDQINSIIKKTTIAIEEEIVPKKRKL